MTAFKIDHINMFSDSEKKCIASHLKFPLLGLYSREIIGKLFSRRKAVRDGGSLRQ